MNRLYITYNKQLQIYNWLIQRHVAALFGHHQAYKEMVLIKVHSFAIPMGSHGLLEYIQTAHNIKCTISYEPRKHKAPLKTLRTIASSTSYTTRR